MNTIGIKDAAARFNISAATLYRAVAAGKIAAYKPGRAILLDEASLDDWFKAEYEKRATKVFTEEWWLKFEDPNTPKEERDDMYKKATNVYYNAKTAAQKKFAKWAEEHPIG